MTFRLTMYPGMDGDCLLLSWGTGEQLHHIVVDLGRGGTYKAVREHLSDLKNVELFVISHVDADHIAGAMPMVREAEPPFAPSRVWYNARPQLVAATNRQPITEPFGARQGEKLSRGIVKFNWPWNGEFDSEIVSTDSTEASGRIPLADGLTIRLLSPGDAELAALLPKWDIELAKAKVRTFDPDLDDDPLGPRFEPLGTPNVASLAGDIYEPDRSEANGASIAFLAEFEGKRVLLGADAHSEVLETALAPLAAGENGRYRIDLYKVSHHGSKANTSKGFLKLIDCGRFAFSTSGSRHEHPDAQTIARVVAIKPERAKKLYFNYRQPSTEIWDSRPLKTRWNFESVFPVGHEDDDGNGTLSIDV